MTVFRVISLTTLVLMFTAHTWLLSGQTTDPYDFTSNVIPSPSVHSVQKYGELMPTLFNGEASMSIPLYEYKDEDFDLPISMDYHYSGYKPSHGSGYIGLGWSLRCGGYITRTVQGLPDDYWLYDESNDIGVYGYYFATNGDNPRIRDSIMQDKCFKYEHITSQISSFINRDEEIAEYLCGDTPLISPDILGQTIRSGSDAYFDSMSDIYQFSLPDGHSGTFIIRPDGSIQVISAAGPIGEYKISLAYDDSRGPLSSNSSISIVTGNGTEYIFGGNLSYIDYVYVAKTVGYNNRSDVNRLCFSGLRLSQIKALNGRKIELFNNPEPYLDMVFKPMSFVSGYANDCSHHQSFNKEIHCSVQNIISRRIDSIKVDGHKIAVFLYGDKQYGEYCKQSFSNQFWNLYESIVPYSQGLEPVNPTNPYGTDNKLESLIITNCDGIRIDSIGFIQSYTGNRSGNSTKMFLKGLTANTGRYSFDYFKSGGNDYYPSNDCISTDHWGYWRGTGGGINNTTLYQSSSLYNTVGIDRAPVDTFTIYGALKTVTYPTGGVSEIEYTPNVVNRRVDCDLRGVSDTRIWLDTCSVYQAGGVRVSKIRNKCGQYGIFTDSLLFDYRSSGILTRMPRYTIPVESDYIFCESTWSHCAGEYGIQINTSDGLNNFSWGLHIEYPEIRVKYSDGSYSDYSYTSSRQYRDVYIQENVSGGVEDIAKHYMMHPSDPHLSSWEKYVFVPSGDSLLTAHKCASNIVRDSYSSVRGQLLSKRTFSRDSILLEEEVNTYSIRKAIETKGVHNCYSHFCIVPQSYYYAQLMSTVINDKVDNGYRRDTMAYSYNGKGQITRKKKYRADGFVETLHFKYDNPKAPSDSFATVSDFAIELGNRDDGKVISLTHFEFDSNVGNGLLPVLSRRYVIDVPYWTSTPFVPHKDTSVIISYEYDVNNRISGIHSPGWAYKCFEWDSSGKYLITRYDNGPISKQSYRWKDMVGLVKQIDKYGRNEYYEYDNKGRLSAVFNADSIKINTYQYSLATDSQLSCNSVTSSTKFSQIDSSVDIIYFNGLGFPVQSVSIGGGSTPLQHTCRPIEYDAMRRDDAREYLPYPTSDSRYDDNAIEKQKSYYRATFGDVETRPYKETLYDSSPAGKMRRSQKPGIQYEQADKHIMFEYRLNTASDSIFKIKYIYDAEPSIRIESQYLSRGTLLCSSSLDECGMINETFSDSKGNAVLCRQKSGLSHLDTYYVYDLKDSLVCVIQPEGSERLVRNSILNFSSENDVIEEYSFLFIYDGMGNVIRKKLPGCGWSTYIYDARGRVVLMNDGNMATDNQWIRNKYDKYDNLIRRSIISSNRSVDSLRFLAWNTADTVTNHRNIEVVRDTVRMREFDYEMIGQDIYYPVDSILKIGGMTYLEDGSEYSVISGFGSDEEYGWCIEVEGDRYFPLIKYVDIVYETEIEHELPDWNAVLDSKTSHIVTTANYSYDRNGYSPCGAQPPVPSYLAFSSDSAPISLCGTSLNRKYYEKLLIIPPSGNYSDSLFIERAFYYDRMGRLLQSVEKSDVDSHILRSDYRYDLQGNVLIFNETVSFGSSMFRKYTQNEYDKRGRPIRETVKMDDIQSPISETTISYDCLGRKSVTESGGVRDTVEYNLLGWLSSLSAINRTGGLLFGQMLEYDYKGDVTNMMWKNGSAGWQTYNYTYDGFGRLTSGLLNGFNPYSERDICYDKNGNMLSLKRYSESASLPLNEYIFTNMGNKVLKINDGNNFSYDWNGNVAYDPRTEQTIGHNYLNRLSRVSCTNGDIVKFQYSADGVRVSMINGSGEGRVYIGDMVFKKHNGNYYSFESNKCLTGRIISDGGDGYNFQRFVEDNIGSVRVIYWNGIISERNDYYPFGGRLGYSSPTSQSNRYRFSCKESQSETGMDLVDFGARMYDSNICRWVEPDPLATKNPSNAPYNYCNNNPYKYIDPYGTSPIYSTSGLLLGTDDQGIQGEAIIMEEVNFCQGMSSTKAKRFNLGENGLQGDAAIKAFHESYSNLYTRPDWDGIVSIREGVKWAKSHVGAKDNPTPENMLYIDASKLDFGGLTTSDFVNNGANLFKGKYWFYMAISQRVRWTTYALGLFEVESIKNNSITINNESDSIVYDWNPGGGFMRRTAIWINNIYFNIDPTIHGFKTQYYGIGKLRK